MVQHGLRMESVTAIDSPTPDNAVCYRLYAARRPQRVPNPACGGVPVPQNDDRTVDREPTAATGEAPPWTR